MPLLRLLLAGLVALAAMVAVFFTAAAVMFAGLVGYVAQLFRPRRAKPGAPLPERGPRHGSGEIIDIEATKVPDEPPGP